MPDYFDRLIARGTQQPGGRTPAHGQPGRRAASASEPGDPTTGRAAVTFALPRLPGPFERPAAEQPDRFLEAVDEVWETGATRPPAPRARPDLGGLAGTQAAITPPPLLRDATTLRAPRQAMSGPGERPPGRPAPPQQAPLLAGATPVQPGADAAAPQQASARPDLPDPGEVWGGWQPFHAGGLLGAGPREVAGPPGRILAVPVGAVRAARPAADEASAAQAQPPAPPPVTVRIGRIEVRDTSQDRRERQPNKRAVRAAPKQTLAEYLAAAGGGRNGSGVGPGGAR